MGKKVLITETILRDAHQSQAATRMRIEDMIPALERLDKKRLQRVLEAIFGIFQIPYHLLKIYLYKKWFCILPFLLLGSPHV